MKPINFACLKLSMLVMVLGFLFSSPVIYGAARAAAGTPPEVEGFDRISAWVRADGHNVYGRKMEAAMVASLDVLLERMEPAVRTFRANLTQTLSNDPEFRRAASRKSNGTNEVIKSLLSTGVDVASSSLGLYLVYNSPDLTGNARAISYGVCGLSLVKSAGPLIRTIWDACSESCAQPFLTDENVHTEANKISYLLSFQSRANIIARSREIDALVGEYTDRVLGALASNYLVDSRTAFINTILVTIGRGR